MVIAKKTFSELVLADLPPRRSRGGGLLLDGAAEQRPLDALEGGGVDHDDAEHDEALWKLKQMKGIFCD